MKSKWRKKFGFKRLLMLGLCNLISGIVFGAGCLFAEHIDNWRQSQEASFTESAMQTSTQK